MQRSVTRGFGASQAARGMTWALLVVAAMAVVGVIHLAEAPEYLEEEVLLGISFLVGGVGLLAGASVAMLRNGTALYRPAVDLVALIMVGMFVGGIASRTIGLRVQR
jgi:hypothetical protein